MSDGLAVIADLLAAIAAAHSPRTLVRAIAAALSRHASLTRVELATATAVFVGGDWQVHEDGPSSAREIVPGLAVVATRPLPELFAHAAFRDALTQVIAMAARHVEVIGRVAQVARKAHADNRELRALRAIDPDSALVARSPAMREVARRVELVAPYPTTVLLVGETGAGKDVIGRELHRRSPRAHRPMISLNCAAIPELLVESQLFGHERGAFTGADRAHAGVFEQASGGTLLLDEIGDLPAPAQAKLLRALQERSIRRVGAAAEIAVDIRLIAATNRPLEAMVEAGTFREDLFYRLAAFRIRVPPLRERREDFAPLVAAVLRDLAAQLDLPTPPISKTQLARLSAHDWPGNVRELRNRLEECLILGGGDALVFPDDFPGARRAVKHIDAAVRATIEDALRATRGRIYGAGGAAARLGIPPATLQSKMKKLGVERARFV